jgi:hypothetical protein
MPSEILQNATALDYSIMNLADEYTNYRKTIAETGKPPVPKMTQAQLQEIVNKTKKQQEKK